MLMYLSFKFAANVRDIDHRSNCPGFFSTEYYMLASLRVSMNINEGNGKIYENGLVSQPLHALTPI